MAVTLFVYVPSACFSLRMSAAARLSSRSAFLSGSRRAPLRLNPVFLPW
jgi:hypothetical protein